MKSFETLKNLVEKPISGEWGDGEGKVNVIRTTNFRNDGRIDFSDIVQRDIAVKKVEEKKLFSGDIIIEKSGGSPSQPVGRVVFFDAEELHLCNNFTSILRPIQQKVFPKYLHYILFCNHKFGVVTKFQNKTTGIINLKLASYLEKTKIPLPPLAEQKQIAAILDAADSLRQKDQQLVEHYTTLSQSLFLEMFGDPVLNPLNWPSTKVENVCTKIYGGGTPTKTIPKYFMGDIPWVTPKDMKKQYISDSLVRINHEAIQNSSAKLIPENSVLMVIRSGVLKHTLPLAISTREITINQDLKAFIPDLEQTNSAYLLHFFKAVESFLLGKVRAVTADNLEFNQIKKLSFPAPPLKLQNQFAERIAIIEQQKQQAQTNLQKSEVLFNSLLQRAFTGELTANKAA